MTAVILAAGMGTRMQKKYPGIPKVMLPLGGKPLLEHQILHLKKFGFDKFFINLHYMPDKIKSYLGDGKKYGVKLTYSYEPIALGTSGALINFKDKIKGRFIVLYGDIFTKLNLSKFLDFHLNKKSKVTLLVHKCDHPADSDLVEMDEENRVIRFYISPHNKPITRTNLSSAAIYILESEVLNFIPKKIPSDFIEDMFPDLLKKNFPMYGYQSSEYSKDMGTPQRYEEVKKDIITLNL